MKNGEGLKRYEIGRYTFGIPTESPTGPWVRYYDYDNLLRRKELVHRKLIETLNRERVQRNKIKELEKLVQDMDQWIKENTDCP